MQVRINGIETAVPDGVTIHELVLARKLVPEALVVEHNQSIVRRETWPTITLAEHDALEFLSFVGGG